MRYLEVLDNLQEFDSMPRAPVADACGTWDWEPFEQNTQSTVVTIPWPYREMEPLAPTKSKPKKPKRSLVLAHKVTFLPTEVTDKALIAWLDAQALKQSNNE